MPARKPRGGMGMPPAPGAGTICFSKPPNWILGRVANHRGRLNPIRGIKGGSVPIVRDLRRKIRRKPGRFTDKEMHLQREAERIIIECEILAKNADRALHTQKMQHNFCNLYNSAIIGAVNKINKKERPLIWKIIYDAHEKGKRIMK